MHVFSISIKFSSGLVAHLFCLDDSVIVIARPISLSPTEASFLVRNMVVEVTETPNGWPLGLGIITIRLIATQNSQPASPAPGEESPTEMPSPSFSSFSSSNLDTESTESFFPDRSVSLGRLMGLRPGNGGSLQFSHTMDLRQRRSLSSRRSNDEVSGNHGAQTSHGLCVPLLQNVIERMSRSKSTRH